MMMMNAVEDVTGSSEQELSTKWYPSLHPAHISASCEMQSTPVASIPFVQVQTFCSHLTPL
jgi:hypothetical protein